MEARRGDHQCHRRVEENSGSTYRLVPASRANAHAAPGRAALGCLRLAGGGGFRRGRGGRHARAAAGAERGAGGARV